MISKQRILFRLFTSLFTFEDKLLRERIANRWIYLYAIFLTLLNRDTYYLSGTYPKYDIKHTLFTERFNYNEMEGSYEWLEIAYQNNKLHIFYNGT
jgi:hypothetical protein